MVLVQWLNFVPDLAWCWQFALSSSDKFRHRILCLFAYVAWLLTICLFHRCSCVLRLQLCCRHGWKSKLWVVPISIIFDIIVSSTKFVKVLIAAAWKIEEKSAFLSRVEVLLAGNYLELSFITIFCICCCEYGGILILIWRLKMEVQLTFVLIPLVPLFRLDGRILIKFIAVQIYGRKRMAHSWQLLVVLSLGGRQVFLIDW